MSYTPPRDARAHTPSQSTTHSMGQPTALPVHRWLRFADSWDECTVHRAFDTIGVRRKEVIYDPFVGCGTTPVAAAVRGLRTVSMDRSALAVLGTAVKLYPPDRAMLDEIEQKLRSCPCNILIRKLQVRRLRRGSASPAQRALVFALMAGWFRARNRYHQLARTGAISASANATMRAGSVAGAGASGRAGATAVASTPTAAGVGAVLASRVEARWLDEALRVVDEMRADQPPADARPIQHVVRCRDFTTDVTRLPGLTGVNSIVMVTSLPLPVRHVDTDHQRLDRMIHTTVPRLRIFDRHDHHTEALGAVEMKRVSAYEKFLDEVLAHAQNLRCTAVAIEVSSRPAPQGKPCDELLMSRLPAFGFTLLDSQRSVRDAIGTPGTITARPREPLTLVCAVAVDRGAEDPADSAEATDSLSSEHPSDTHWNELPEP
jgi:hypothetical protein